MTAPGELEITGAWAHLAHVKIFETSGKISSDQTVRFPITSRQGLKYTMVLYDCDGNSILAESLKSCAESKLLREITALYKHVIDRGLQPRLHIMYNELSKGMKNSIYSAGSQHQMVPPRLNHSLIAKRSIHTFKHHLIDGISSCDPFFSLHLWCRLIWQSVLTLDILLLAKLNPHILSES